jgi:hypothetical protein
MPTLATAPLSLTLLLLLPATIIGFLAGMVVMGVLDDLFGPGAAWQRRDRNAPEGSAPTVPRPLNALEQFLARLLFGVSREELRSGELRADSLQMMAAVLADEATPPPPAVRLGHARRPGVPACPAPLRRPHLPRWDAGPRRRAGRHP